VPPRGSETDSIGQDVRRDIGYQAYQENHQPEAHERRQILSKPLQARPLSINPTVSSSVLSQLMLLCTPLPIPSQLGRWVEPRVEVRVPPGVPTVLGMGP
jgi:hypothetical protein